MAADSTTGGFGRKLREARERRGTSLRQIAHATKISIGALEALERNDFSRLPGGIFSRSFVRSYAVEVGLDPEETIQEFIAQLPHEPIPGGRATFQQAEDNDALESHRRMASASLRLIAVSLPIAGLVIYYSAGRGGPGGGVRTEPYEPASSRSEPSATPTPATITATMQGEPALTPMPVRDADRPAPAPVAGLDPVTGLDPVVGLNPVAELLTVGVAASGPCWVSAIVDGETTIQRELQAGERQVLQVRRELVLTAGDAASLTLTLNGEDARPLGKAGQVVNMRVNPANFKEYLVSR